MMTNDIPEPGRRDRRTLTRLGRCSHCGAFLSIHRTDAVDCIITVLHYEGVQPEAPGDRGGSGPACPICASPLRTSLTAD